jgi:cytidylate kinase
MGTHIKAIRKFEKKRPKKRGPTITISGISCSGKNTVAEYLAKKLKLKFVDAGGEFWRSIAKKRGLDLDKLSKNAEKKIDIEMDKRTLELAQKGKVVLMGRLTGWAAGDWADFKIMLTASEEERARRSADRDKIPLAKARKFVKNRDKQDRNRYIKRYGIDIFDYSIYNLVLDTTNLSIDENRKIVLKIIKTVLDL